MKFEMPEVEVIVLENVDVITSSDECAREIR